MEFEIKLLDKSKPIYLVLYPSIIFSLGVDDDGHGADNNKRKKQLHFLIICHVKIHISTS
jgi:hypothetical protein